LDTVYTDFKTLKTASGNTNYTGLPSIAYCVTNLLPRTS